MKKPFQIYMHQKQGWDNLIMGVQLDFTYKVRDIPLFIESKNNNDKTKIMLDKGITLMTSFKMINMPNPNKCIQGHFTHY